jgi:hypothetical protein
MNLKVEQGERWRWKRNGRTRRADNLPGRGSGPGAGGRLGATKRLVAGADRRAQKRTRAAELEQGRVGGAGAAEGTVEEGPGSGGPLQEE